MEERKFYTCRYDRAFKEVFFNEKNEDLLRALLESIFMAYICSTYSHEVLNGEDYMEDVKFIQINFTYGLKEKEPSKIYKIQDEKENKYVNKFFIYEFNMDYFMELWCSKNEKEIEDNKYLIMLDLKPEELELLSDKDKVINKYMSEIKRVNENPFYYEYMSAEEDDRKIENSLKREFREEGLKEGIKEGKKENSLEIAKKMLYEGLDRKLVIKVTGLSEKELDN